MKLPHPINPHFLPYVSNQLIEQQKDITEELEFIEISARTIDKEFPWLSKEPTKEIDYEIEERPSLMYHMPECEISSDSEMRIFSLAKHNAEPQSLKLKIPKILNPKIQNPNKNKKFKRKKLSKSSPTRPKRLLLK